MSPLRTLWVEWVHPLTSVVRRKYRRRTTTSSVCPDPSLTLICPETSTFLSGGSSCEVECGFRKTVSSPGGISLQGDFLESPRWKEIHLRDVDGPGDSVVTCHCKPRSKRLSVLKRRSYIVINLPKLVKSGNCRVRVLGVKLWKGVLWCRTLVCRTCRGSMSLVRTWWRHFTLRERKRNSRTSRD